MLFRKRLLGFEGLTLIELLVVVSVIGVLSGVLIRVVNLGKMKSYARDAVRQTNLEKVVTALESYSHAEGIYPPGGDLTNEESVIRVYYLKTWPEGVDDEGVVDEDIWGYKYAQLDGGDGFEVHVKNAGGAGCYKYHTEWGEVRDCKVCDNSNGCE
ncbi:type II secretion system protein [candidate division WWE3 bacterium]|nr:type II secretion system protein [candidate division WWE3 bacterium]